MNNALPTVDPFSATPLPLDGLARPVTSEITNLGPLTPGQVIRIAVQGQGLEAVRILRQDDLTPEAGAIAGGGPVGKAFDYRIQLDGTYAIYLQLDPQASLQEAMLAVSSGDPALHPPSQQFVQVVFQAGYLSNPGLFDPDAMTPQDQQVFANLEDSVRQNVLAELHRVYDPTPLRILSESDPLPAGPFSKLIYSPQRTVSADQNTIDAALPADTSRPECNVRVDFGEVLPHGRQGDPGNQTLDDEAVVYVGSFQGRGATCHTAVINSLNNVVYSLSQTGAHEIGHLIGLEHVTQIDIMNPNATLASFRQLDLHRGQVLVEVMSNGQVISNTAVNVLQDPELYFRTAFDSR